MVTNDEVADQISHQDVWFYLMDSNGHSFRDTTAVRARLALGNTITDLTEEIAAEDAGILTGIIGSQLKVFKNKGSFAKFVMELDYHELPLMPSFSLEGLGTNDHDNALVVVVPFIAELRRATRRNQALSSKRFLMKECFIPDESSREQAIQLSEDEWMAMFYNGIVSHLKVPSDEQRKVMFEYFEARFPILGFPSGRQRIFVRPCYKTLFDILVNDIKQGCRRVSITGNPGIGKSQFFLYCAWRFAQGPLPEEEMLPGNEPLMANETNHLILNASNIYYLFENDYFRRLSTTEVLDYQVETNVIRLIDGQSDQLTLWSGVSILFTSPGCPEYHKFMTFPASEYVMPPWTYKELSIAASRVTQLEAAEVQKRFSRFGGIARLVLARQEPDFDKIVDEAMSKGNLMQITGSVSAGKNTHENQYTHVLVHMYPIHRNGAHYKGKILRFASHEIAEKVYKKLDRFFHPNLINYFLENERYTNSMSLRDKLFEIHCHHLWEDPGTVLLTGRSLQAPTKSMVVHVPETVETVKFQELMDIPKFEAGIRMYCQQEGGNYPCIHAIYWDGQTCILLQVTTSENHSILQAPLVLILEWCEQRSVSAIYVFVVPTSLVDVYKPQKFVTDIRNEEPTEMANCLAQYVVGVDLTPSPGVRGSATGRS